MRQEPERSDRLSDLSYRALEHAPGERGAVLDAACRGDDSLRREIDSLLAYDLRYTNGAVVEDDASARRAGQPRAHERVSLDEFQGCHEVAGLGVRRAVRRPEECDEGALP